MRKNITGQQHPFFLASSNEPQVIAHRGGAGEWPGETIYAFKQAVALGVDILEMDIRYTRDNHIVLMHDPNVRKTTGTNKRVKNMDVGEITSLRADNWWRIRGITFRTTPTPRFLSSRMY